MMNNTRENSNHPSKRRLHDGLSKHSACYTNFVCAIIPPRFFDCESDCEKDIRTHIAPSNASKPNRSSRTALIRNRTNFACTLQIRMLQERPSHLPADIHKESVFVRTLFIRAIQKHSLPTDRLCCHRILDPCTLFSLDIYIIRTSSSLEEIVKKRYEMCVLHQGSSTPLDPRIFDPDNLLQHAYQPYWSNSTSEEV